VRISKGVFVDAIRDGVYMGGGSEFGKRPENTQKGGQGGIRKEGKTDHQGTR